MFGRLLKLYDSEGFSPFAETQLFSEGWLLVGVLKLWQQWTGPSRFPFLPFPERSKIRSPVQLYVPFRKIKRIDALGETNTRADGIAGHFQGDGTKSGVVLSQDAAFLAAFEAKMSSGFSPIKNSPYSQVSRTIACMIHSAIHAKVGSTTQLHFAVLYPQNSRKIKPSKFTREVIEAEIVDRIAHYRSDGRLLAPFEAQWRQIWARIAVTWATWEDVVDELNDSDLREFYRLCKNFN